VKMFDAGKTRMIGLPYGGKTMTYMYVKQLLSNTGTSGRTDGRTDKTDGQNRSINIARQCADARASVC